jgi:hypothetical protein
MKCREARTQCEHGRKKNRCKDCGTGYCQHKRRKDQCKDCGTGYCQHKQAPEGPVQGLRHGAVHARPR